MVDRFGKREEVLADSVVIAIGFNPQTTLIEQLRQERALKVFEAGDCVKPRKLFDAIHEGHLAAYSIAQM
jgi:thioredoxin reductase